MTFPNSPSDKATHVAMASYLSGASDCAAANENTNFAATLKNASRLLSKASRHMCSQGFYNCKGGDNCQSDHK